MKTQWAVQAHAGIGWVNVCHTENRTEAERKATELRKNDFAWRGSWERRVRIVPCRISVGKS